MKKYDPWIPSRAVLHLEEDDYKIIRIMWIVQGRPNVRNVAKEEAGYIANSIIAKMIDTIQEEG